MKVYASENVHLSVDVSERIAAESLKNGKLICNAEHVLTAWIKRADELSGNKARERERKNE